MTDSSTIADRSIAVLRAHHDALAGTAADLSDEQLDAPSGATEWSVAQVLSHLGSQSEIMLAPLLAATGAEVQPEENQTIWARWDASTPREQADGFIEHSGRITDALDALTPEQRSTLTVDLGFLPEPVPLSTMLGMRLNEVAQHAWDVRAGLEDAAEIDETAAATLLEHYSGGLAFLLGFTGKADRLDGSASVAAAGHTLVIDDKVSVVTGTADASATFAGPAGAVVRLMGGRLRPEVTPADVTVEGDVTLDDLRKVFPGG